MAHVAAVAAAATAAEAVAVNGSYQSENESSAKTETDLVSADCVNLEEITSQYGFYLQIIAVTLLNVHIVVGNLMVILAVYTYRKLRQSQTNTFIVSLAFSDFLLGVAVMPFTSTFFLLNKHWIFGTLYCRIWLAVDVWLCTASILNLVAISYERYLAIKKPMSYTRLMTYWRTRVLLVGVWILALMISVPGLLSNDGTSKSNRLDFFMNSDSASASASESESLLQYHSPLVSNTSCEQCNTTTLRPLSSYSSTYSPVKRIKDNATEAGGASCVQRIDCSISESSPAYIVYSACGSFFVPAAVMLAFYVEIYKTARRTLRAMHTGQLLSKGQNSKDVVVLRVHIGGHAVRASDGPHSRYYRNGQDAERQSNGDAAECLLPSHSHGENGDNKRSADAALTRGAITPDGSSDAAFSDLPLQLAAATNVGNDEERRPDHDSPFIYTPQKCGTRSNDKAPRAPISRQVSKAQSGTVPPTPTTPSQNSRANRETKAAKTVAIICGSFLLCWLGFFCAYLLSAFCDRCVPDLVWDILFWLGYINSACNPCVYALFSRDFRTGFSRLLHCVCCWGAPQRRRFKHDRELGHSRQQTRRFDVSSALGHSQQHHVHYRRTSASQSPLDDAGSTRGLESGV